ncbi:unnamed protein product [Rotaria sp. Silwood2]|nr:unnamed protein product [Rotaria sp. Silwood2]CAF2525107.1 unnamed protein product [Rotaria sp. Silwood2]CAF2773057.1 unnamed protein product [Rotaria sp. Silwood2]CAF2948017.1 unnamed protein product [Rotaria sp. Silwood2]CAF3934856.1 unnamed protein product [Rotaria sp. Silwood2]
MSQDSLIIDEPDNNEKLQQNSSITMVNSRMNSARSVNIDEHIKLVKQKKEEAEVLRLQRFQEQMRKKEQKWQQQHLEKVKKWLELRNRDTGHRSQVEERRKKREEETKVKIEEILRREKERQQRSHSQIKVNLRGNASHRPDSVMSMSSDIVSTRRATSAPRIRTNQHDMANRRRSNDSPISTLSQDNGDNSTKYLLFFLSPSTLVAVTSSRQLNPIDEHRYHHRPRHSYDATMTNEDNSLSGTPRTVAHSRTRPMPTSYTYWLNTGDNNNNMNASFMRLTYAATCRSRVSRSVERCPRACRVRDDLTNNTTTTNSESQRRIQSINRQHLNETILRLSKPKTISTSQSINSGTTASPSSTITNGIPSSQSSHQFRVSTPPMTTNNSSTSTSISSKTRRPIYSRPATASPLQSSLNNDSRASPTVESTSEHHQISSSVRQSSHRTGSHPKLPIPLSSKPPTSLSSSRSKQPMQRSLITPSHSSSSISSATTATTTTNKKNIRRIGGVPPSKQKPKTEPISSVETSNNEISTKDTETISKDTETISKDIETIFKDIETISKDTDEENLSVNEDTQEKEKEEPQQKISTEIEPTTSVIEPINIDTVTEIINPTTTSTSKREQQIIEEQEYQRKLNQKIREAQQRMELERQREEERKRQLELEEYEREQEQIRLVEEQRLAEKERLQRAIEERERENELKRQEEQRLQQQREELERKQAEETERLNRERQERAKKEEEERNERKRRLDLIMRRTRQDSPSLKPENNISKTNIDETNGHEKQQSPMTHSISDNRFPISVSNDNFLNNNDPTTPESSKFKSPLIQSLLNKARSTKSSDNLIQSNMTTSQIMNESLIDEETATIQSTTRSDLSDDDDDDDNDQQDSGINNTTNGHSDSPLSSSTNLNSSHDRPLETATTFE